MTRFRLGWFLLALWFTLPYLVLFVAGSFWLYQYGYLSIWLAVALLSTLAGWITWRWLRKKALPGMEVAAPPPSTLAPAGQAAWSHVEAIARRAASDDFAIDQPDAWRDLAAEVLRNVARHYHPERERPELQTPISHVLRVVELAAADVRRVFSQYVPGGHLLTLGDVTRTWRMAGLAMKQYQHYYLIYRILQPLLNVQAAAIREIRDYLAGGIVDDSGRRLKAWTVELVVRRLGYYAILLYSGQLTDQPALAPDRRTRASLADERRAATAEAACDDEPLRILVAGQVKAGKSSLINALFGETKAAVDVVPRTRTVEPYLLERDGVRRALVLDTAGYEDANWSEDAQRDLTRQIESVGCDLLLLVVSAINAARAPDRKLLDGLRRHYHEHPTRLPPPLLVVLTQIDRLRPPGQWDPPYNLARPDNIKAEQIAACAASVARSLDLALGDIVPVCLRADAVYNVDDALAAAVLEKLPAARRAQYLRCIRHFQTEDRLRQIWQQVVGAGRLVTELGRQWLHR